MAIDFFCPHCGLHTLVDDPYVGQSGPCYRCGQPIQVVASPALSGFRSPASSPLIAGQQRLRLLLAAIVACGIGLALAVLMLVVRWIEPSMTAAKMAAQQSGCEANLQRIAAALQSYHDQYGCFPPASIADKNGKPMHSWRVLILPELGYESLYKKYDFSLPWNDPANQMVAQQMPRVFACPGNADSFANHETQYMVLVGKNTAFPGPDQSTRLSQFQDGPDATILLVETAISGVLWTDPSDLSVDTIKFQINGRNSRGELVEGISSPHGDGAHVVMANGVRHFLHSRSPPDYVRALSTISGDEKVPASFWRDAE